MFPPEPKCKKIMPDGKVCNFPIGKCIHDYKPTPFGRWATPSK